MPPIIFADCLGLVLAGGKSTRMGRDKALMPLGGRPMITYALSALRPITPIQAISANPPHDPYHHFNLPLVTDEPTLSNLGPVSGILSAMSWVRSRARISCVVSVPSDMPFVTTDILVDLLHAHSRSTAATTSFLAGSDRHPALAVWNCASLERLQDLVIREKILTLYKLQDLVGVTLHPFQGTDLNAFDNLNRPSDFDHAQTRLSTDGDA